MVSLLFKNSFGWNALRPFYWKMTDKIVSNNNCAENLIHSLKEDVLSLKNRWLENKKKQISQENELLRRKVEELKKELIVLETQNGKIQVPLRGEKIALSVKQTVDSESNPSIPIEPTPHIEKEKKVKKVKTTESASAPKKTSSAPASESLIDVSRLDLRIGKIVEVSKHPDADSLYLEKIDCGEEKLRTVISGLVKFIPIEEMQNRIVVLLCNLKPVKMRGILSEAMVMCASTPDKVEVLIPPKDSVPGDLVSCEGYERNPDPQLNPKKKVFETCAPDLKTDDNLVACYKGAPLYVTNKGKIVSATLKNAPVK